MPATVVLTALPPSIMRRVASWVVLKPGALRVMLKVAPEA